MKNAAGVSAGEPVLTPASSALAQLRLTPAELRVLSRQGFVHGERKGRAFRYKLRFRVGRVQKVRCLGTDPEFALRVERELEELQRGRRMELAVARAIRAARRELRSTKQAMEQVLGDGGFAFHGNAIRRRRIRRQTPDDETEKR